MKRFFWLFAAFFLTGTLCSCAPQGQVEFELQELRNRLAQNERTLTSLRQKEASMAGEQFDALARGLADLQGIAESLRVEQQALKGQLEDQRMESDQVFGDLSLVRDELGIKISSLEERLEKLEGSATAPKAKAGSKGPSARPPIPSAEDLYKKSLQLIRKDADFVQGRKLLKDFLSRYPDHNLAVNASYWIGEAYYGEKRYEETILQLQKVIKNHADHPKASAALLKQGLAFYAMGDQQNASTILQKVISGYPGSDEAKKAALRLKEWKK